MKLEVYKREDGKWAWRVRAGNGQIIATDGGQGYDHLSDAHEMALRVLDLAEVQQVEVFGA